MKTLPSSPSSFFATTITTIVVLLSFVVTSSQAFLFSSQGEPSLDSVWHSVSSSTFTLNCLASEDLREQHNARIANKKKEQNSNNNKEQKVKKEKKVIVGGMIGGILEDLTGMFNNLDDVLDDFVCKRMGAGEQFYGKRKYNPSGKYNGAYNGMGRSDVVQIEIARALREEKELRKLTRLAKDQGNPYF